MNPEFDFGFYEAYSQENPIPLPEMPLGLFRGTKRSDAMTLTAEKLMNENMNAKMILLTNFQIVEFKYLYSICGDEIEKGIWSNNLVSGRTRLLLCLISAKYNLPFKLISNQFNISRSYASEIIWETIRKISKVLSNHFIKWIGINEMTQRGIRYQNYPLVLGSLDATVQACQVPRTKRRKFLSGKHRLICVKSEVLVNPMGSAIHVFSHEMGSVHDLQIARKSGLVEKMINENNSIRYTFPNQFPQLFADKGYIGINQQIPGAIVMCKKPRGGQLSAEDVAKNNTITHHRVIVENWFGRHKTLWRIMSFKWNYSHSNYTNCFYFCSSLTNYHISLHSLGHEDRLAAPEILFPEEEEEMINIHLLN